MVQRFQELWEAFAPVSAVIGSLGAGNGNTKGGLSDIPESFVGGEPQFKMGQIVNNSIKKLNKTCK